MVLKYITIILIFGKHAFRKGTKGEDSDIPFSCELHGLLNHLLTSSKPPQLFAHLGMIYDNLRLPCPHISHFSHRGIIANDVKCPPASVVLV